MKSLNATLTSILSKLELILKQTLTRKPYIPIVGDEIYGTWRNPNQNPQKLLMLPNGTWKSFDHLNDTIPSNGGNFQVTKKWRDHEGNLCYHDNFTLQIDGKTCKAQEFLKIHREGASGESVFRVVEQFDNKSYPKVLDSKSPNYLIFFRAEEAQS